MSSASEPTVSLILKSHNEGNGFMSSSILTNSQVSELMRVFYSQTIACSHCVIGQASSKYDGIGFSLMLALSDVGLWE